ncbi:HAD-IC family P-type ATPase [Microbacterium sp.]|uniref:DsbA family protein n=1 Tax=Microbacterium sp. TaxID=51671 RepID=UPI003C775B3D
MYSPRPLVPAVLIAAALVAVFGFIVGYPGLWVERALVVLVAASPCALAIAVPVTVISAIGSVSKFGVVIKSGEAFEQFGTIRTVALDKTGTLTRNEPQVVEIEAAPGRTRDDVLALAAALESTSTHPLAAAITAAAPGAAPGQDVVEEARHGIIGRVGATAVRVGNVRWLNPGPLQDTADEMAGAGMTVVVVEAGGQIAGLIGIRDELRPEAAETIQLLNAQGIRTVSWGDQQVDHSALFRSFAEQLELDLVAYDAEVADPATRERIEEDAVEGRAMGVQGTPTFFLDGEKLELTQLSDLTDALDRAVG